MQKKKTFNMNVSLSYNMFKWEGPLDIKGDIPFWYPNNALIHMQHGDFKSHATSLNP
jgi:hypothetical protein